MNVNDPIDAKMHHQPVEQPIREASRLDVQEIQTAPQAHEIMSTPQAAVMYAVAVVFLGLLAGVLPHGGAADHFSDIIIQNRWVKWALVLGWLMIVSEGIWGVRVTSDMRKPALMRLLTVSLMPPFRMMISPAIPNRYIWLPRRGWLRTGQEQLEHMEWRTALPMLVTTLLILPVIGAETFFHAQVEQSAGLSLVVYLLTTIIWFAFAYEFILLVSVAERKVDYCKVHWVNMVIILLPIVAFLRTLQLFRFLRLAKAGQLIRAYRLRGIMVRAMRLALVFNLIDRFMQRNPYKYCVHLEEQIREKEEELDQLKAKLQLIQSTIESSESLP